MIAKCYTPHVQKNDYNCLLFHKINFQLSRPGWFSWQSVGIRICLWQFRKWHWAATLAVASPYQGVKLGPGPGLGVDSEDHYVQGGVEHGRWWNHLVLKPMGRVNLSETESTSGSTKKNKKTFNSCFISSSGTIPTMNHMQFGLLERT